MANAGRLAGTGGCRFPVNFVAGGSALTFYGLRGQTYVAQERSQVLPLVRRDDLLPFLENRLTMGEISLVRQFRQWVQKQLQGQG